MCGKFWWCNDNVAGFVFNELREFCRCSALNQLQVFECPACACASVGCWGAYQGSAPHPSAPRSANLSDAGPRGCGPFPVPQVLPLGGNLNFHAPDHVMTCLRYCL